MNELGIHPLFSQPLYEGRIDIDSVNLDNIVWAENYNNFISTSTDVLEMPEFSILKEQVMLSLQDYFYDVLSVKKQTEIYITESWLNKSIRDQMHHRHWHPNSVYSGIVILQADKDTGLLNFITGQYQTLEYEIETPNLFNAKSMTFCPDPGTILIFPSNLEHLVTVNASDLPRISLSFNTFIRGIVNNQSMTQLKV
jgi:uncharacterized protein (TIGR02466 family)